jgi:hypothetical protein
LGFKYLIALDSNLGLKGKNMGKTPEQYRQISMHYATGVMGIKSPKKLNRPAWNYAKAEAERERLDMKKLYQEKSGDYSY